jgi:hypothetical protein
MVRTAQPPARVEPVARGQRSQSPLVEPRVPVVAVVAAAEMQALPLEHRLLPAVRWAVFMAVAVVGRVPV